MEKIYTVYELYDIYGNIVDVGETTNPKTRFYQHVKAKPNFKNGSGKHYGKDLIMYEVAQFVSREDARVLEGQLKLQYGLEWTEKTRNSKGGLKSGGHNKKLTYDQALEIRDLRFTTGISTRKLAKQYGVGKHCIANILNGLTYIKP